jgi:DNA (cytosine-5)-methyltransferase 1
MLDTAFEEYGFCVVRGPDVLWGGDIRRFHPPAGKFDGVIGGPPCQAFSPLVNVNKAQGREPAENLIPEFERCVAEAFPGWFLMENVKQAPVPVVAGYVVHETILNNRWVGGEQNRERRFSFGTPGGLKLWPETVALEPLEWESAVTSSMGGRRMSANPNGTGHQERTRVGERCNLAMFRTFQERCRLQGLPDDFDLPGFTVKAKHKAVANGVPMAMGRAMADAVRRTVQMGVGG